MRAPSHAVTSGMLRREKIAAVVVTYHPDELFPERMERLAQQVDSRIIVDNHSGARAVAMLRGIASRQRAKLLLNPENLGIAAALNIGVETAIADGYEWALLLDQDTVVGEDIVETLAKVYEDFADKEKLALIGSNHTDPISGRVFVPFGWDDHGSWQEVKAAITSGSLISLRIYHAIGPFREEFFIDCVDIEYCLRARARGFKVIMARKPLMQHSIGTVTMHKLPWKSVGASNHSPVRRYYMTRNQLVLAREYLWKEPVWTVSTLYAHLKSTIAVCFLEQDILRKLQYTALGIVDGLRSNFSRQLGS
jgi:rhamnosyltransferase